MFKKTITYTDFDGNEVTETLYFNLSKAKVIELEASVDGGYGEMLRSVVEKNDVPTMMKVVKRFILDSYGIKSEDGKRFRQSEEISKEFEETEAYSELFYQLCTDAEMAAQFINGILPLNAQQKAEFDKKVAEEKAKLLPGD